MAVALDSDNKKRCRGGFQTRPTMPVAPNAKIIPPVSRGRGTIDAAASR